MPDANPLPDPAPSLELTPEAMLEYSALCARYVTEHVASLGEQPSWDMTRVAEVARELDQPVPEQGGAFEDALAQFARAVPQSFTTAGPGYLAYIPGGGLFPAALAEYLANAVNRYVGVWNAAPGLAQLERTATDWLRQLVRYPAGAAGLLTTGGSISNLIGVYTARRERLGDDFTRGVIYASKEAHHCVEKAGRIAGFGARNFRVLPVDERRRLRPDALARAVAEDRAQGLEPFLVVANGGTTNTGAVDPLVPLADLCRDLDLWLHVDAAYGGFFRMVADEDLLPGLELADSVTLDPHKTLFLPYGTGCLLVKDAEALKRAHACGADYLQDLDLPPDAVNYSELSPELSRELRGLRVWLPLKMFGAAALRAQLKEKLELARWAWRELRDTPGFECLDEPQLSVVPFRFVPDGSRGEEELDALNAELLRRVNARKRVFLSSTRLDGRFVLRICVVSFRTRGDRVRTAVEDLREAARELTGGPGAAAGTT